MKKAVMILGAVILIVASLLFYNCQTKPKIIFLKNGEVWITDKDGQKMEQITKTKGKVENFLFSPTLRYLAYSKIIKYIDSPGIFEAGETVPKEAVCSIVIMDLKNKNILREIMPQLDVLDEFIYLLNWLPKERLLFYGSSGFDVAEFYRYDVQKNTLIELNYNEGSRLAGW